MTALETWRKEAACLGMAPLFDATIDDGGRYSGETTKDRVARHELAKAVCRRCPVALECGATGRVGYDEGVRNAVVLPPLSEVGRSGQPRQNESKCGTPGGEKGHKKRGEEVCLPCSDARRKYDRDYNRNRRSA